jgi:hypothetical protein
MMTGAISNWVAYIERCFAYAKFHRSALSLLSSALKSDAISTGTQTLGAFWKL